MNFKIYKSHFRFTSGERNGILVLLAILISLLSVERYLNYRNSKNHKLFFVDEELQLKIDSMKAASVSRFRDTIYPFNPNFLTDFRTYQLGLPNATFDKLQAYRRNGNWVNSTEEFQRITGLPDSTIDRVKVYFRFPEWVNKSGTFKSSRIDYNKELPYAQKTDLNLATAEQLEQVYGIGPTLSSRIIKLRERLSGFNHVDQLYGVYGISDSVIVRVRKRFAVKTPVVIQKIDLQTASASDLATIPGVNFDLAKRIWEFNRLREGITDLSELKKIEGMTPEKIRLISVYLSTIQTK